MPNVPQKALRACLRVSAAFESSCKVPPASLRAASLPQHQDLRKDKDAISNIVIFVMESTLGAKHPRKTTLCCHMEINKYTRKEQEGSGCLVQAPIELQAASTHTQQQLGSAQNAP